MSGDKKKKLPEGWRWETIENHISDYQSGIACGDKSKKEGYPHLRMNNISNGLNLDLSLLWRIPATENEIKTYCVQRGDLLFNNTNSAELVGKSCLFDIESNETYLFSNHLTRIRTKSTLNAKYLLYWINFLWQKRYFKENCDKWVNQAAVRVEDLLFPFSIPIPPTPTDQNTIAADLERRMAQVERMRGAALRQKEAVAAMQGAILWEVFPYKEGDELPKGWRWEKLIEICDTQSGGTPSRRVVEYYKGTIPWVKSGELKDGFIYKTEEYITEGAIKNSSAKIVPAETLLIALYGATVGKLGILKIDASTNQAICAILCGGKVNNKYLFYYLLHARRKLLEISFGGAQPNISQDIIKSREIPLPSALSDQLSITAELEHKMAELEKARQAAKRQLEAVEALPGAILREVFDFEEENIGD